MPRDARLGASGRVLVRKSGTEPLIRVMAEGEDEKLVRAVVRADRRRDRRSGRLAKGCHCRHAQQSSQTPSGHRRLRFLRRRRNPGRSQDRAALSASMPRRR